MGAETNIGWTNKPGLAPGKTWNPWHGCERVSPGCDHCYMLAQKKQYGQAPDCVRSKTTFYAPLKWNDPALVFTCSWSDWFIADADPWRDEAWAIIEETPHLTYQILTKRPARIKAHLPAIWTPWPNVWLGVSIESRDYLYRADVLRAVPAALRFLSLEPLLDDLGPINLDGIGWVIVGAESGSGRRPFHLSWLHNISAQCDAAGVPLFVKQDSAQKPGQRGRIADNLWRHEFPMTDAGPLTAGTEARLALMPPEGPENPAPVGPR